MTYPVSPVFAMGIDCTPATGGFNVAQPKYQPHPSYPNWHPGGVSNPYSIGSTQWIQYQQQLNGPTDIETYQAELQKWKDAQDDILAGKIQKYPELTPAGKLKRRLSLPPFQIKFDNNEDARLRLLGTVINVGGSFYYVNETYWIKGKVVLLLEDADHTRYRMEYPHPAIDLRTPDPQYFMDGDTPAYFLRVPARQQQQGLAHRSILCRRVGEAKAYSPHDTHQFMRGLTTNRSIVWSPAYSDLMTKLQVLRSIRLSPAVAFYRGKKDKLMAEFRSRTLGEVNEDHITMDEDDYSRPWIREAVARVGCVARCA